jgi:hypothetical protein
MIKFFRKIRQNLLMENKTGKYFKYAIGEIILVVIGILIALSINNWNENRKSRNLESEYYCRLLEDSNQDVTRIEQYLEETKSRLHNCNKLLSLLQKGETSKNIIINEYLYSAARLAAIFRPNTSAFDDLKSSGNLNLIRDINIKNEMNEYYVFLEEYIKVVERNSNEALDTFLKQESYVDAGWTELELINKVIDTTLVNKSELNKEKNISDIIVKKYTSDILFHIGINARNIQRYQTMSKEIIRMNLLLQQKCSLINEEITKG